MTITMNTSTFPSSVITGGPELGKEDLQEFVNLGIFTKIDNHREHYAIQPCWIHDPAKGVLEEIDNNVLGRWNNKLNTYVVAVNNIKNFDTSAGMNEDHRWLHIDVNATYYTFSPEEGQRLKGQIKKVGNRAAICMIFDVFTVTVFAEDQAELATWNVGDELRFEIYSFIHRRKGPIIRAKSITEVVSNKSKRKLLTHKEDVESEEPVLDGNGMKSLLDGTEEDVVESRSSRKEKKKKKKIKIKEEVDDSGDYNGLENVNAWGFEDVAVKQDQDFVAEPDEDLYNRKKKKKKKKSSRND